MGEPLVAWLDQWYRARAYDSAVRLEQVELRLSFSPIDVGDADTLSRATIRLPDRAWVCAEAWGATSNCRADFGLECLSKPGVMARNLI